MMWPLGNVTDTAPASQQRTGGKGLETASRFAVEEYLDRGEAGVWRFCGGLIRHRDGCFQPAG